MCLVVRSEAQEVLVKLTVNGADVEVDDRFAISPLLWVLRDALGLHGTKYGCGIGYCAACTVLIDGRNTKSCQTPAGRAIEKAITGQAAGALADDDTLAQNIVANVAVYGHPTSTAPMGGSGDPWAVVDSVGAVKGVSGLRVVDASIIPEVPSSTTNVTVIMLAERIYQRVYAS